MSRRSHALSELVGEQERSPGIEIDHSLVVLRRLPEKRPDSREGGIADKEPDLEVDCFLQQDFEMSTIR